MKLQKLQRISNKKVTKRDQKQKSNKNGIINLQYKHSFRMLQKQLSTNIQESWISHARLVMHGSCMPNYTLVQKRRYGLTKDNFHFVDNISNFRNNSIMLRKSKSTLSAEQKVFLL